MRKPLLLLVSIFLVITLTVCSLFTTVKDPEIIEFNQSLKTEFSQIKTIKTYITRPVIRWDIYVNDTTRDEEIFHSLVKFLKDSNIYENKLRMEYTGTDSTNTIYISFIKGKDKTTYEGDYYQRGTTIYPDDKNNVIDNFTNWNILTTQ